MPIDAPSRSTSRPPLNPHMVINLKLSCQVTFTMPQCECAHRPEFIVILPYAIAQQSYI